MGVLMDETGDGTQGLAKTSTPVSIPPTPFSHKGRRGSLGVLKTLGAGIQRNMRALIARRGADQGRNSSLPLVARLARARCASAACSSG